MAGYYYYLVLVLVCSASVNCEKKFKPKQLPDFIVPCSASAPDLSECVVKHSKDSIPHILKGVPKFKVPPLVPFHLDKVELKPSDRLTLILKDLQLYGLDNMEVKNANIDLKNKHLALTLFGPSLKVIGNYSVDGQVLVLPIQGEGKADLDFVDGYFEYACDFDLIKKSDGKEYMGNLRPQVTFRIGKAHFQLDNLFNGNKQLGESTNKVLNDNHQEVLKDFGEAISEIIKVVATGLLKSFFDLVPYDEIFLP